MVKYTYIHTYIYNIYIQAIYICIHKDTHTHIYKANTFFHYKRHELRLYSLKTFPFRLAIFQQSQCPSPQVGRKQASTMHYIYVYGLHMSIRKAHRPLKVIRSAGLSQKPTL